MRWVAWAVLLALGSSPGVAAASVSEAEVAFEMGDRELAGELIRDYLREHPESARSARVAALLARTASDPADAMGRWDEVIALEPAGAFAAEAHWMKGIHAYSAGLYVAAGSEFSILAEMFPSHFDPGRAHLWKGYAGLGADFVEDALESFRDAERYATDPLDVRSAQMGQANASFRLGNVREALRKYSRFESDHPDDGRAAAASRRAVECLRLLGRESDALKKAADIEKKYPHSFEATLARAEVRSAVAPREVDQLEEEGPAPRAGPFLVQVASMTNPRNAADLRRRILSLGIRAIRVEPGEGPQGPVHRVILGPFETEDIARAIADSVAALGDLNPRVKSSAAGDF
jgi:tetratricopeptide (TPR) repeat protein